MNYNEILSRCLSKIPTDIDTREGSFIYTALAPLCYELAQAYFEFTNMLDLAFLDSAYGEYLDRTISVVGISRNTAVKCQKLAEIITTNDIIGEKFSVDQYIFTVTEQISQNNYIIEATDFGSEFNSIFGNLTSIMNLPNISSAKIAENYILASDVESDENLRIRAISHIITKPFGGNVPDYEEKALTVSGVSYVYVFNASNLGVGRVHLVVSGSEKTPLSDQIIQNCANLFIGTGSIIGLAPIGHTVTVSTNSFVYLSISCKIVVENGSNEELIIENAKNQLEQYISDLNFANATVSRNKMISYLLQIEEISDVEEFLINGKDANYTLSKTYNKFEICKLSSANITISN
ncbi:MAG: baseplate J/gp47 family protein [Clostridia bacterium]